MTSRNPLFISKSFFEILPPEQDVTYIEVRNGIYEGQLIQNKRQGKGIFIWDDSSVYVGDWVNDQPHGEGILFMSNGCYIFGQFECGKLNGKAMIKFANESRIFGQWKLNQLRGICFFYESGKREWRMCEFKQGLLFRVLEIQEFPQQGQQQFFSSNNPYDYIQNTDIQLPLFPQFSRRDIELFALKNILQRMTHFSQNTIIGQKQLAYIKLGDDLNYFGFTQNNVPEGLGVTIQDNTLKNIGCFKQSIMQGLGRVYSENGLIFDGNFEKGHLSGLGFLYNSETNLFYEGLFYENECNKLFKKSKGYQVETILKHRSTQHKQASSFSNQLLVLEIAQIIQGQTPLVNLYKNNKSITADDMQTIIQTDSNPLYSFIQKNKEYMENKRHNCFYYPNQVMNNRQLFNTSSLSSHQGLQATSYPYEEYEFSLHEFQRQLERPTLNATIISDNFQLNDRQNNQQSNNYSNQNSMIFNNNSNLYSRQKNNASPGQQKNIISAMSTNQANTRISSPQTKTLDSFVSYHNETETPLVRTPKQKKFINEQNAIERKLTFSNAVNSNHNSNSQLQARNPYFQMIPQSSNQESLRNSPSKQNQTQTSYMENTNNQSYRSQNIYNYTKTVKKQGNQLYEQIRGRSNTPNLTNKYTNNYYNNADTVVEREKANPHNNQNYNIQQNKQNALRTSLSNNSQKTQYLSLQNPFKSQLNITHNSSNYSTSQNNIPEIRNSNNSSQLPKSKIFNRPKSSMNQISREPALPVRFQTINDNFNRRSISPAQTQQQIREVNIKQASPLRVQQQQQQQSNKNISPISSRIFKNNSNAFKKSESPIPKIRMQKQPPTPPVNINTKLGAQKQKENIKQVHLRLPSSFFN